MKLTKNVWLFGAGRWMRLELGLCLLGMVLVQVANTQAVSTTTVQGTVYLANGQAGAGTLDVSWPAFTTANNQAITAGRASVTIAPDGFMTVNLAPNQGATPAGLYYTAVYHMSDGTTSTEYWVVPAAAQASLGQVRAQLMPAAQAVQAVSKAYVDQSIAELTQSLLTASGGTLSGPLYLNGDPTQPLQAADKHYVDSTFNMEVPIAGGNMTGPLATPAVNGVQSPVAGSTQTTLQAAINAAGTGGAMQIPPTYAGTDSFTNPNGVRVMDLRPGSAQQTERSVKEFGAVCDGTTDDTNALQAALNFALAHGMALTIPQGTCKTRTLNWHGESIGGMGKQVSALMGFPGQDVLATVTDSTNLLANTRIHDLTIYVDQSVDASCSLAEGRAPAGSCALGRLLENNSIFSAGGSGLTGTAGTGAGWAVGNCAIAMPAATGSGGNGLRVAEIENLAIAATGADPMAAQYPGAHSTHTCGLYLAQWPQWSEFRNIDIRGVNTGVAIPALPVAAPAGLNADSNRWQNITIQATHGFTAAAGSNNVLDNVVTLASNSAATAEPPTGLVLDFAGSQQGWTVRNAVVLPAWIAVQPQLTLTATGGAVTGVTTGPEHGLGFDPYGTQVPLKFSGSCTAQATANVNSDGSIGTISVTRGGTGCSGTTTASVNVAGTWDTSAPVNLIAGQSMSFFGGNLLKGNGGYTVWNAAGSQTYETQLDGGGGTLRGGGSYAGLVANSPLGTANPVDQFPGADFGAKLQNCLNTLNAVYGGTCDARNFTGTQSMGSNLTISTANATVLLPCATISTANQVIVTAGTRNVSLRGCSLRGASTASGSQGGTAFLYSGTGAMVQVGAPTYSADTMGFHLDNVLINTTAASSATAKGLAAYRTQEMDLESLYFLGNQNQTGMTLDGTGNYTGGTFFDNAFNGFQTAVNAIGHQVSNPATTDWMNASTFVRLHIDCPTIGGNQIAGTYGINLQQGDGNTFTGGDVEGCSTALHLGPNAQNNTIVGLRNENSTNQVVADAGSAYNNWMTGGTMFTGALTDNGTRNSFLDTFHRSFNGMNGDWYGSQKDATITNHYRLGIGAGNERGLEDRYETDYGYRWTTGLSDATAGEQFYQVLDELNNVYRISIGQYNNGQSSTNNQTVINAAGTGAVVLNASNNSGTGGVIFGSGGASATTVATINNSGNAQFNGTLQVGGTSTFISSPTVKNQADAEIDATLWAGSTASQKESFIYKDYNGNSQWYMVKDAGNNWALNSATGGLDSFKAYQSTNSGDTYINASNSSGAVRVNYETGSGTAFNIYGGGSNSLYASFTGTTAIKFPGLAASSGHNCLQIDSSGYVTNTGSACGSGSGSGGSGTVNSGTSGQVAYYSSSGAAVSGVNTVPVTAGGTGAGTATGALANLGGLSLTGGTLTGALTAPQFSGPLAGNASTATALAATPAQCSSGQYATGVSASGAANCTQVVYSQLGGTIPTWNQNTTGTASSVTGTVGLSNGGTGATTAAGAIANLLPGVTSNGANGIVVTGSAQFNGTLQVGGTSTFISSPTVKNQADAEIDATLWAGLTASQKESFIYKDYNGNNQWYMMKDNGNNWALNSATSGLDSFKAYQSTNSGDTYINASNSSGAVRVNYETGSGTAFNIYGGGSNSLYASFTGTTAIKFPGLAASSGHSCLQIDNSGYVTNTGSACGSSTGGSGTVSSGNAGQIAYYTASGTAIGGVNTVPLTAGGTGATTAAAGLANLGGVAQNPTTNQMVTQPTGTSLVIGGSNPGGVWPAGLLKLSASWDAPMPVITDDSHIGISDFVTAYQNGNEYFVPGIPGLTPSYYPIYGMTGLNINSTSYTLSDSVVNNQTTNCNSPGDCNAGIVSVTSSNGAVNGSEEGAHGGDLYVTQMAEPSGVVSSTSGESGTPSYVMVNFTSNSGNQGDGKLLVDTQPGKVINGTRLSPGVAGSTMGTATPFTTPPSDYSFNQASDTSWSLTPSTIVQLCYAGANNGGGTCASGSQPTGIIPAQTNNMQPAGPVTLNVVATYAGLPSGYCNSGNLQSSNSGGSCYWPATGVMCLADWYAYETVSYTYNQSAQTITFSPKYPHINGMSAATGGACGEAVEATVDGMWFPVVGSLNSTTVLYAEAEFSQNLGPATPALGISTVSHYYAGVQFSTSGQACETDGMLASFSVNGNTITATASSAAQVGSWAPFNGMTMTITTPNSTYNGNWPITVGASSAGNIQYTLSSPPSGATPTTGTITYCNLTNKIAPAVMSTTVYNPSTKQVDGYIGLEPSNSPFSNGDAVMQVSYPWVHFSERHNQVSVNTPQVPGTGGAMTTHQYNGLMSGSAVAETYNNTTPLSSYAGLGGTHLAPQAVITDYGAWTNKWEMQYPPAAMLAGNTLGAVIAIDSPWPSPIGSANQTLSNFYLYRGPFTAGNVNDYIIDEMGTTGRMNLPNAIGVGSYDPTPTVLYMKSAGVVGVSKDANTKSYTSDGELDAGILSATTVNTTSASVSGLTGYVYANGSSTETASATIPGSAVSGNIAGNAAAAAKSTNVAGGTAYAIPYQSATDATTFLTGSVSATKCFVQETGTGSAAQAPACAALQSADIPNNAANTSGTASNLSGTPALPNGTTATTQSTGDNSTKIATTAYVQTTAVNPKVPAWLQYLGDGSDSSNTNASGNMDGEYYYTNFTVPYGNTVTVSGSSGSACGSQCWGLTIHATGTCTIAGTITNIGYSASTSGRGGGVAGGSGGGSSAGAGGNWTYPNSVSSVSGGAAGTSSGGNGGNAYQYFSSSSQATSLIRTSLNTNPFADGVMSIGAPGVGGANSGGVGGAGGGAITLICGSIVGTDGTHTGIIDASGHAGGPPTGNSTGAGSGGGGAPVILSSQATVGTWPAAYVAGGPGGWNVVPYATWTGGTCTSPAKATLGVSVGALSGACTVVQAGAGCGTGAGTTLQVLGGGGTLGTGTVTPTWSGGALASCTATAGSSSGYTATTYTTAGTGGDGGYGWVAEFSGW